MPIYKKKKTAYFYIILLYHTHCDSSNTHMYINITFIHFAVHLFNTLCSLVSHGLGVSCMHQHPKTQQDKFYGLLLYIFFSKFQCVQDFSGIYFQFQSYFEILMCIIGPFSFIQNIFSEQQIYDKKREVRAHVLTFKYTPHLVLIFTKI